LSQMICRASEVSFSNEKGTCGPCAVEYMVPSAEHDCWLAPVMENCTGAAVADPEPLGAKLAAADEGAAEAPGAVLAGAD